MMLVAECRSRAHHVIACGSLDRPALTILALHKFVHGWQVRALQALGIPLDALAFASSHGEIADEDRFGQAPGIAEVRHRTWFVFAFDGADELPLLTLVATCLKWDTGQGLLRLLEVLEIVFRKQVVLRTIIIGREQESLAANNHRAARLAAAFALFLDAFLERS